MTNRVVVPAVVLGLAGTLPCAGQVVFDPPERLTDGAAQYQLSRNPGAAMAFGPDGRLHATYWSGAFATSLGSPSFVYYQNWTPGTGWSQAEVVDNSVIDVGDGPQHFGGRHPSLAIGADGAVTVVWHDHRHCDPAPPANGIDNLEIYADRRPAGGAFSDTDIRLTNTDAPHLGDNGYMANIAAHPDGTLSVMWYDFHADGDSVSDLYVLHSDTDGVFDTGTPITSNRVTFAADRDTGGDGPVAYTMPDIAVDAGGEVFAVWTSGTGGPAPVYFSAVPNPAAALAETELLASGGGFFDPPRLAVGGDGALWVATTRVTGTERDVVLLRRPAGATAWEVPALLAGAPGVREESPAIAFAPDGTLHAAWIDGRDGTHVYHATVDTATGSATAETRVTPSPGDYARVSVTVDPQGNPVILYEQVNSFISSDIWFARAAGMSAARGWDLYR